MRCPRCQTVLERRDHDGVRVDTCATCAGVFLHRGELNRIAPTEGDLEFSTLHEESFRHEDEFGPIACPACSGPTMNKVEFNVYSGIMLDYCPACRGFWLDGKELDRIVEEVRGLDRPEDDVGAGPLQWFAQFLWSLPR
ncbi:MAG TPA: zf-TFIIB domain-containing protein [Candidatus Polarisedimenticolaceae bacterium]|nr:zf-TFIIB domain-containing protein [Candidatus Polarisedimenticolaceae bacterium]